MASLTEQSFDMFASHNNTEDFGRYPDPPRTVFTSGPMELSIPASAFSAFPRHGQDIYPTAMGFEHGLYSETPSYMLNNSSNSGCSSAGSNNRASPGMYTEDGEVRLPSSSMSTASAPSAASSAIGSPQSNHDQMVGVAEWAPHGFGVQPSIVGNDCMPGAEYSTYTGHGMDEYGFEFATAKTFVGELDATSPSTPRHFEPLQQSLASPSFSPCLSSSLPTPTTTPTPAPNPPASLFSSSGSAADQYPPSISSSSVTSTFIATCSPKRQPSLSATSSAPETFSWPLPRPACPSSAPSAPRRTASLLAQDGGGHGCGSQFGTSLDFFSSSRPLFPCRISQVASSSPTLFTDIARAPLDPSLIHSEINRPPMGMPPYDAHFHQNSQHPYPASPSISSSPQPNLHRTNSSSPFLHNGPFQLSFPHSPHRGPMDMHVRQPSMGPLVPATPSEYHSGDESKDKRRCTYPDCGKVYKDLKAHMLTHQNERPEKCPIQTCEYHVKGFARKYDKNRHTLTHYKGTMVCGFCPGSGSAAEKSFNRADVFKRHLTAVHGVEQAPPNSRKKSSTAVASGGRLSGYAPDATGKCSTCSQTFANAQDFYEHLDDCVLRIVQQEDPAEAINARAMAEVENDKDVHETLEKNNLPTTTEMTSTSTDDDDTDMVEEEEGDDTSKSSQSPSEKKKGNPANGVQKSRGVTHSRGGPAVATKIRRRKNRRDYPSSWGFDKGQMTMKKRVLAVFDGQRRLAKDDMMLSTDHEVRIKLSDGKSYVTDLDVQTLKRAEGFLGATDEEKGPWISDDPTDDQLKEMQKILESSNPII